MAEAQIKRRESDMSEAEDPTPKCEFSVPDLDDTEGDEIIFLGGVTLSNKELLTFVENTVTTCCHLVSKLTGKTLPVRDFVPTAKQIDPDKMRLFFVSDGECKGPTFKYRGQYLFIKNDLHSLIIPVGTDENSAPVSEKTAPVQDSEPVPDSLFLDEDLELSKVLPPTELFAEVENEVQADVSEPQAEVKGQGNGGESDSGDDEDEVGTDSEKADDGSDEEVAPPVGILPTKRPQKSPGRYESSTDESDKNSEPSESESEMEAPQDSDIDPEYVPSPVGFRKMAQIRIAAPIASSESEVEAPQGSDTDPDYVPSGVEDDDEEIIEDDATKNVTDSDNSEKLSVHKVNKKRKTKVSDTDFKPDKFEKSRSPRKVGKKTVKEHSYASPKKAASKKSSGKQSTKSVQDNSCVQKVNKSSVSQIQDAVSKIDVVPKETAPASECLGAMMAALSRKQTALLSYKSVVLTGINDPLDTQDDVPADRVEHEVISSTVSAQTAGVASAPLVVPANPTRAVTTTSNSTTALQVSAKPDKAVGSIEQVKTQADVTGSFNKNSPTSLLLETTTKSSKVGSVPLSTPKTASNSSQGRPVVLLNPETGVDTVPINLGGTTGTCTGNVGCVQVTKVSSKGESPRATYRKVVSRFMAPNENQNTSINSAKIAAPITTISTKQAVPATKTLVQNVDFIILETNTSVGPKDASDGINASIGAGILKRKTVTQAAKSKDMVEEGPGHLNVKVSVSKVSQRTHKGLGKGNSVGKIDGTSEKLNEKVQGLPPEKTQSGVGPGSLEEVAPADVDDDDENEADAMLDCCETETVDTEMKIPAVESVAHDIPPTKRKIRMGPKSYLMKIDPERCCDDDVILSSDFDDSVNMQPTVDIDKLTIDSRSVKLLKRACSDDDSESIAAKKKQFLNEFEIVPIFEKIGGSGPPATQKAKKRKYARDVEYELPVSMSSSGRAIRKPDRLRPDMVSQSYHCPSVGMTSDDKNVEMKKAKMTSAPKKTSVAQMKKAASAGHRLDQRPIEEEAGSIDSEPEIESAESRVDAKVIAQSTKELEIATNVSQIGEQKFSVNYVKESPERIQSGFTLAELSQTPPNLLCSKNHDVHDSDCCYVQCVDCRKLGLQDKFGGCNVRWGDLPAHLETHKKDAVWLCEYLPHCRVVCYSHESRQRHLSEHRCDICGIVNRTFAQVERHGKLHVFDDTRTGYECVVSKCRGAVYTFKSMFGHLRKEHSRGVQQEDIIVCGYNGHCPFTVLGFEEFQAHFKSVHECLQCNGLFNTELEKLQHKKKCNADLDKVVSGPSEWDSEMRGKMSTVSKRPSASVLARGLQPIITQDVTKTIGVTKSQLQKAVLSEFCGEIKMMGAPPNISDADGLVVLDDGTICVFRKVPEDGLGGEGAARQGGVEGNGSADGTEPQQAEDEIDGDEVNLEMTGRTYTFQSLRGVLIQPLLGLSPKTLLNIVVVVDTLDMKTLKANPKAFEITKTLGRQAKRRGVSFKTVLERPIVNFKDNASDRWLMCTPRHFDCLFMHGFVALSLNGGRGWLTPQPDSPWVPNTAVNLAELISDPKPDIPLNAQTNPDYQHFLNLRQSCVTVPMVSENKKVSFKGIALTLVQPLPLYTLPAGAEAVVIVVTPTRDATHSDALEEIFGTYADLFLNFADAPAKPCSDPRLQGKKPLYLICPPRDFDVMYTSGLFKLSEAGVQSPGHATISHVQQYAKSLVVMEIKTLENRSISCKGIRCRLEQAKFGLPPGAFINVVIFVKEKHPIQSPPGTCLWSMFGDKLMQKFWNYSAEDVRLGFCKSDPHVLLCSPGDFERLFSDGLLSLASRFPRGDIADRQVKCVDPADKKNAEQLRKRRAKLAHVVVKVQDFDGLVSECHGIKFVFKPSRKPVRVVVVETTADIRNSITSETLLNIFGKELSAHFVNFSARPIRCVVETGITVPHIVVGLHEFDHLYEAGKLDLDVDEAAVQIKTHGGNKNDPGAFPVLQSQLLSMLPPPEYMTGTTLAEQQTERNILSHVYVLFGQSSQSRDFVHGLKFILKCPILGLLSGTEVIFILNADSFQQSENSVLSDLFGDCGASYVNLNLGPKKAADVIFTGARYVICNVGQFERFYQAGCLEFPSDASVSQTGALKTAQVNLADKSTIASGGAPSWCLLNLTSLPPCSNLLTPNLFVVISKEQTTLTGEQTTKEMGSSTLKNICIKLEKEDPGDLPQSYTEGSVTFDADGQVRLLSVNKTQDCYGQDIGAETGNVSASTSSQIKAKVEPNDLGNSALTEPNVERRIPKDLLPREGENSVNLVDSTCEENKPLRPLFAYTCLRRGCSYKTNKKIQFHLHVIMLHGNNPLLHVCRCCKAEFSSQDELTNHIAGHLGDATTISADILKKLDIGADEDGMKEINVCRQCGECSTDRVEFFNHVTNHGNMVWPCGDCGQRFSSNSALALHQRQFHNFGRQYMCEVCFVRFESFMEMLSHRKKQHMSH